MQISDFTILDYTVKELIFSFLNNKKDLSSASIVNKEWHGLVATFLENMKQQPETSQPLTDDRSITFLPTNVPNSASSMEIDSDRQTAPYSIKLMTMYRKVLFKQYTKVPNNTALTLLFKNESDTKLKVLIRIVNSRLQNIYTPCVCICDSQELFKINFIARAIHAPLRIYFTTARLPITSHNATTREISIQVNPPPRVNFNQLTKSTITKL